MPLEVFDARAAEYDAWYDSQAGATIFGMEVDCLRPLLQRHERPYLEIGVGPGRFARALGIEYGLDPSPALLRLASTRGIQSVRAIGEKLPFPDKTFGGVLIAFTLCFVREPAAVFQEAWRVLQPGGGLVLGFIPEGSPWAEFYSDKGRRGHPIYSMARFYSKDEVENLLQLSGFEVSGYRSVLLQLPGQRRYRLEHAVTGFRESAGFVAIDSLKPATWPAM